MNLISTIQELLSALRNKDIDLARDKEEQAAELLAQLRLNQVPAHELPFTIPNEYDTLPRLKGRATIRMILEKQKGFRLPDGNSYVSTIPLEMIVDGYHAPITAGNFVDLVQRHFYDNMILNNVEQLTITTGKASSSSQASPQKTPRTIPLELFYKKDTEPVYGITSDDDLRATDALTLPFQAYGALGMGRENNDPDSGSTEFFFLKWLQALIPPGRNTLDGYYSCFGYIVKNEDFLKQIEVGDRIVTAQVIQGLENLELSAEN